MSKDKEILDSIADKEYEHGFVTDVEQELLQAVSKPMVY